METSQPHSRHTLPGTLTRRTAILALSMLVSCLTSLADVTVEQDGDLVKVANEQLSFAIDLSRGARIGSYIYKGFGDEELVHDYQVSNGGMFKDLWAVQGWPGEFNKRKYDLQIVKRGPDEVVLKTWTMSTGVYANQTKQDIADIMLEKTFRLKSGERVLTVDYAFTNKGKIGKRAGFWSQSAIDFDGTHKNNIYWRPTRHCVDWIDLEHQLSAYGHWYTAAPVAGWNGVSNRKMKRGIVFLMDYNDLRQFYDNAAANTVEWMYDDVAIPAGKTWRTTIQMIPTEGYGGYVYADRHLVADFTPVITPAGLTITHTLSATTTTLKDVVVQTEIIGVTSDWSVKAPPLVLAEVGLAPIVRPLDLSGLGQYPCVIKVDVAAIAADGKPVITHYENYFGGTAGRNLDLTTLEPLYEFNIPEKTKQYLKPDQIELTRNKTPRVLFIRGLWAEYNGIDAAVKLLGDVEVVDGWMKKTALGETVGNFPGSYEVLLDYDVIILGNISGPMLSSVGQEMLADFLGAGGGLLMLGGDRTYGQTTFSNRRFADMLPVTFKGDGDYARLPTPSGLKKGAAHATTEGLSWGDAACVLYAHQLGAADGAVVTVSLDGNQPALILSGADRPRVAVAAVLPFGRAPEARKHYRDARDWQQLMANTVQWLARRDITHE